MVNDKPTKQTDFVNQQPELRARSIGWLPGRKAVELHRKAKAATLEASWQIADS